MDRLVAGELSNLAGRDAMGKAEASRILDHLMKPGEEFNKGPSRWAHTAIEESIKYLGNWQHWESQDPHVGASTVHGASQGSSFLRILTRSSGSVGASRGGGVSWS